MLVELMVALLLAMLVLSIATTLYLSAQASFTHVNAMSEIQENSRLIAELLRLPIQMAGQIGCGKLTEDFPIFNSTAYPLTTKNKILIKDNEITVRSASQEVNTLMKNMRSLRVFYLSSVPKFSVGDVLIISDCQRADVFLVAEVEITHELQRLTAVQPLSKLYGAQSEVSKLEIKRFFVKDTGRKFSNGEAINALYVDDLQSHVNELVQGVNVMQVSLFSNSSVEIRMDLSADYGAHNIVKAVYFNRVVRNSL